MIIYIFANIYIEIIKSYCKSWRILWDEYAVHRHCSKERGGGRECKKGLHPPGFLMRIEGIQWVKLSEHTEEEGKVIIPVFNRLTNMRLKSEKNVRSSLGRILYAIKMRTTKWQLDKSGCFPLFKKKEKKQKNHSKKRKIDLCIIFPNIPHCSRLAQADFPCRTQRKARI